MTPLTESPTEPLKTSEFRQTLAQLVSEVCGVDVREVGPDFDMATGPLRTSLGRAKLDAKLRRRLGVKLQSPTPITTFAELESALNPVNCALPVPEQPAPDPTASKEEVQGLSHKSTTSLTLGGSDTLACGIDLEPVSAMPEASDYWEDPFYRIHFSPAEIAYCVSQPQPRMHFAARWCAKEAFKKCHPGHMPSEMSSIEVVLSEAGQPAIRLLTEAGPAVSSAALSMAHTSEWASAVVVAGPETSTRVAPLVVPRTNNQGRAGLILSLAALICALIALFSSLRHH